MMIPDTVVGSAIGAGATAFVGLLGVIGVRWRAHRNGHAKSNGCPSRLQEAHGERLASLETLAKTQGREIGEIKADVKTLLGRSS